VVIGSGAGSAATPNWYRNLMAAGGAEVQVGADRWSVAARELQDGSERDECWSLAADVYPGSIRIGGSPTVSSRSRCLSAEQAEVRR
jgi:deazaflavin-dependent oxidoreductase (nitroreductase family)